MTYYSSNQKPKRRRIQLKPWDLLLVAALILAWIIDVVGIWDYDIASYLLGASTTYYLVNRRNL